MGLTSINPLSINGKNGFGITIGLAPLLSRSFLLLGSKAKSQARCKPEPGEAPGHWLTVTCLLRAMGQKDYKNRGLHFFYFFFPSSHFTCWKQSLINRTDLLFFFNVSFSLVMGLRAPGPTLEGSYQQTDPEKKSLARCIAEGRPDGGRHSWTPIIKTQSRKCGVLLLRVQTKNPEKTNPYWERRKKVWKR